MKSQFLLDPSITFLNHGSFGACPKPVFEEFQRFQLELENEPVDFIQKKLPVYLKEAKKPFRKLLKFSQIFDSTLNFNIMSSIIMSNHIITRTPPSRTCIFSSNCIQDTSIIK